MIIVLLLLQQQLHDGIHTVFSLLVLHQQRFERHHSSTRHHGAVC